MYRHLICMLFLFNFYCFFVFCFQYRANLFSSFWMIIMLNDSVFFSSAILLKADIFFVCLCFFFMLFFFFYFHTVLFFKEGYPLCTNFCRRIKHPEDPTPTVSSNLLPLSNIPRVFCSFFPKFFHNEVTILNGK